MATPVVWLDSIDSTNEEARRHALAGQAAPFWIAARAQTAGRGRRGRLWDSEPGNLFCTLLLMPDWDTARSAQLAFAAALAMADAAAAFVTADHVALKWPNDLLIAGRKAGGCLLEAGQGAGGGPSWLAIGIGLNLRAAPPDAPFPATHIAAHLPPDAPAPSPEAALAILGPSLERWIACWRAEGFAPLREAFLGSAAHLGGPVIARLADGAELTGAFENLDETGALILRTADGHLRAVSAADVFFPLLGR